VLLNSVKSLKKNPIVFVDCHAVWCGPCKVISPVFEKLSNQHSGAVFIKVDVDEVSEVAQELGVRAMPTFFAFKNGEKINEMLGANPPALEQLISKSVA